MTLEEALRSFVPFARPPGFDAEALHRRLSSDPSNRALLRTVREAIEAGRVTPSSWEGATASRAPDDFIPAFGRLWDHLVGTGLAEWADGSPQTWSHEALRLWAYTNTWLISSEDEDLALMDEPFIPALLEIAREPSCPKREYILGIVRHWARDTAGTAAGRDAFREVVASIAQHEALARKADDPELADYLGRLGSYGLEGPVELEGAHQRGIDLTRCTEPLPDAVTVERDGLCWLVRTAGPMPKRLRIRLADGRIY